jgi:hypothetical protein
MDTTTAPAPVPPTAATTPVDRFLRAVTSADIAAAAHEIYAPDAVLDAVVPNWRFGVRGAAAIGDTYAGWFAQPGRFEELRRQPLPGGELVEYTLTWEENGVPFLARHAHVLILDAEGRIAADNVWCGGRWDAALMAEMEAAGAG